MHSTTSSSGWIVFVSVLSGILALLKLLTLESLPWIWVLSPLWITALSFPALFVIIALRCIYLSLRGQKSAASTHRLKKWYDSVGNHPFVP
jgi:hypothetical protein